MRQFIHLKTKLVSNKFKWTIEKLIIVLLVIITPYIFGQSKNKNSWSTMQLKGKVKTINAIEYSVSMEVSDNFGEIQPSKKNISYSNFFDTAGNTIEYNRYYAGGGLIVKNIYKYDSIGNSIEMNSFDERIISIEKTTFIHDTDNNVTENIILKPNGSLKEKWTFRYDVKGNKIEEKHFDSKEKQIFHLALFYDSIGRQIENKSFTSNGILISSETFAYDNNNNIIESTYSESSNLGTQKLGFAYEFDKNGNWIKRILYRKGVMTNNRKNNVPISITTRNIEYY